MFISLEKYNSVSVQKYTNMDDKERSIYEDSLYV